MEIKDLIKARRKDLNLTMKELADRVGVSEGTISRWESGNIANMKRDKIYALSRAIDVPIGTIMGWDDTSSDGPYRIPVLGRVAAGIPISAIEDVIDWEELPGYMSKQGTYFGLIIKGNSMEPTINNGDTIIVEETPAADDGSIVVAIVNGDDGVCKRLKKYADGTIGLLSDNAAYQPLYFNNSEIDSIPVQIRGVVKELRRKF